MQQYMLHPFFCLLSMFGKFVVGSVFRRKNLLQGLQNCFILNTFAV